MKTDGKLGRNWLKGALGDAIHGVLCAAGHNIRLLLRDSGFFTSGFYLSGMNGSIHHLLQILP